MTSLPSSFAFGSASSSSSNVMGAIASYHRSQILAAGNAVVSTDVGDNTYDEEAAFPTDELANEDTESVDGDRTPTHGKGTFAAIFEPFDMEPESSVVGRADFDGHPVLPPSRQASSVRTITSLFGKHYERTPLLHKSISFSSVRHPRRTSTTQGLSGPKEPTISVDSINYQSTGQTSLLRRNSSSGSIRTVRPDDGGKSTFGQTLFNSISILIGIGVLSEPFAFAYAGWIGGTLLILFIGFISCYTAKILAHIILADSRLRSYADIGRKAFGPRSNIFISLLFFFEIFSVSVLLVTLYADSLHSIVPTYSVNTYKAWGLIILIPTVFLPLSLLSYASVMGILAILMVVAVIFIDGLSKPDAPGSLWSPAVTSRGVDNLNHLGISFGLFMAGFSGHAIIPVLSTNMIEPQHFDQMIDWAFIVATSIYAIIGAAGYAMFGNEVSDEISVDLLRTPGYNQAVNQVALWMLVVSPLSKFALSTRPINIMLEVMLGLEADVPSGGRPASSSMQESPSPRNLNRVLIYIERVALTLISVGVSILVPEFSAMMALLGSFSAFMLCIIGPIAAKVALAGRVGAFDAVILGLSTIMAVWGTVTAFGAM